MKKHEWVVKSHEAGFKLVHFLIQKFSQRYSARFLKHLIEKNRCEINGQIERFASTVLEKGDAVVFNLEESQQIKSLSFERERVLYEDEEFLIYNKPAGINSDEKGILRLLKSQCPSLQLIHRLDRDTTGILLFAKQQSILDKMIERFRQGEIFKCYAAFVDGVLLKKEGVIENFLGKKHSYQGQTIWGAVHGQQGLYARTDWKVIRYGRQATLLHCFPKTGRTHQIRVHLASIGHPILGDYQYSKQFKCLYKPARYLLHAYQMGFFHPITEKRIQIEASWPEDFKQAQQVLLMRLKT
jgi:23S rRNA pseudouridine955/2504/2580 synthase/23S rRNA pseudouridine1911/1915/1917 synthase